MTKEVQKNIDAKKLVKSQRKLTGVPDILITVVSSILTLYFLKVSAFGTMSSELPRAIYLGATLILIFLLYPAIDKSDEKVPTMMDYVLAAASLVVIIYWYIEVNNYWTYRPTQPTMLDLIMGALLILLCLEMSRRVLGVALLAIGAFFLLQLVLGPHLIGILQHKGFTITRTIEYMFWGRDAIFGTIMTIFTMYVFPFVIFGAFLEKTGGGEFFIDLASAAVGSKPGGPALMAVIASAFFGSISGAPVANAVATGTFTIPLMKKVGYEPHRAAAVEAAASTGGQFMPPVMGAAAFVMATITETPYKKIMIMALIPAFLYFFYVGLSVYFYAKRMNISGLSPESIPHLNVTLKKGWFYIGAPVILFAMIILGYSPIYSAFCATLFLILSVLIKPELRRNIIKILIESFVASAKSNLMVGSVVGTIGIVLGGITLGGLGLRFSSIVMDLAGGNLFASIWLSMFMAMVIGMGLPTTPSYIIMAILVAPAFIQLGVATLPAHFMIFWLALTSNVTPPVCVTAFAAASIAGSNPMKTGFTAMKMCICLYALPFAFVYFPQLILFGTPFQILEISISYTLGLLALAAAFEGWFVENLKLYERGWLLVSAILLFIVGTLTDVVGTIMLIVAYINLKTKQKKITVGKISA